MTVSTSSVVHERPLRCISFISFHSFSRQRATELWLNQERNSQSSMFLLSRRHLRWLSILFILIFSIRLLSKSFQEQGNHDGNLKFEQLQDQSPGVGVARDYNDDSQASNGQPTRKDSLTNTIDFKPSRHFHQHQHHRHHKRTVTAQVWNEYVCKGEKLLALMAMSVEDATKDLSFPSESTFTSYDDLDGNGWSLYDRSKNFNFAHLNVEKVFDDLGFDGTSGGPLDLGVKNRIASWSQDEKYVVDGKEHNVSLSYPSTTHVYIKSSKRTQPQLTTYKPSNAQYINTFNPTQGLIGAWSNYGPAYHLRNEANAVLPNLRQWSDVAFLEWKNQLVLSGLARWGDVEIRAPRMVLRINMMNGVTLDVWFSPSLPSFFPLFLFIPSPPPLSRLAI